MKMINRFKQAINNANTILITTHIIPDADGIGSQIALSIALKKLGKEVYCVNEELLSSRYKYLDTENIIMGISSAHKIIKTKSIDLCMVVDTNSLDRIGPKSYRLVHQAKSMLFIDHHPCPKEIRALHCIDPKMSATGELVGKLIDALAIEFDKNMSLALYTAIVIDTDSFKYPNVTSHTHNIVAKLLESGITATESYYKIYGAQKVNFLKFLGYVLSKAESSSDGSIAWLAFTERELKTFNIEIEETYGFINHLLVLEGIKVCCMFIQTRKKIKISFRSLGCVDVGIIAQALGGGGHNHSAATIIETNANIEDVIKDTIEKLQLMLE